MLLTITITMSIRMRRCLTKAVLPLCVDLKLCSISSAFLRADILFWSDMRPSPFTEEFLKLKNFIKVEFFCFKNYLFFLHWDAQFPLLLTVLIFLLFRSLLSVWWTPFFVVSLLSKQLQLFENVIKCWNHHCINNLVHIWYQTNHISLNQIAYKITHCQLQ